MRLQHGHLPTLLSSAPRLVSDRRSAEQWARTAESLVCWQDPRRSVHIMKSALSQEGREVWFCR